jgi:hypothetical protein
MLKAQKLRDLTDLEHTVNIVRYQAEPPPELCVNQRCVTVTIFYGSGSDF